MNEQDLLETVIEEFSARLRQGDSPSLDEYVTRYPDLAKEIKELLPTIADLEHVKSRQERVTGGLAALGPLKIEQLGDFNLVREIGRGGMGIVFEAQQASLARQVAIKVLPRQPWQDAKHLEQFKQEARIAAGLHHTNIVQIYGVGEDEGYHYYAMQLVEGKGLDRLIQWLASLSTNTTDQGADQIGGLCRPVFGSPRDVRTYTQTYWQGVARVGLQVAEALAYAHEQGIIHRDIKPANLLVDRQGVIWITDFGLARAGQAAGVTQPGSLAGTLRYLAPEQFQGKVDARTDVYSLGVTLYELLTLTPAYEASDHTSLIHAVTQSEPIRPRKVNSRIPKDLETIVMKATASDPQHRYDTAQDLAHDLRHYVQGLPIMARRLAAGERLWLWAKRNPAVAALTVTVMVCLMAAGVIGWAGYYRTQQALERESQQLSMTRAEYQRAEANLNLALAAFEGVFSHMAPRAMDISSIQEEETPAFESMVSARDVAILQNLLGFYQQFAAQNQGAAHLQMDIARASYRIGQIYNRLGQFQQAHGACQLARRLTGGQAVADQHRIWLIENGLELGLATQMLGQQREARDIYGRLLEQLRRIPDDATDNKQTTLLLTHIHLRLGSLPRGQDRGRRRRGTDDPVSHTQTALDLSERLLSHSPEHPEYQHVQALAHRNLAILAFRNEDQGAGETHVKAAIEMLSALRDRFPGQARTLYELGILYAMEEGQALHGPVRKRVVSSEWKDRFQEGLALATDLVAQNPTVPAYLALLSRVHLRLADVHVSENSPSVAKEHLEKAHTGLSRLIHQDLAASSYVCDYLKATQSLGRLLLRNGAAQEGRVLLQRNLPDIERMMQRGPRRKQEWVLLGRQYSTLALLCEALNEMPAAKHARQRARHIEREQSSFRAR